MNDGNGLFQAARLWEREGIGGPYLSGTMGGLRIVVTRNPDPADPDDSGWVLLIGPNTATRPRPPPGKDDEQ